MSSKMKPSRRDNPKRMAMINRMLRLKMLKRSIARLTQVQPMRREPASQLTMMPRPMEMLSYLATVPYAALPLVSACLISKTFIVRSIIAQTIPLHFYLMKKPAKVQLYFSSGCGMLECFTYKPQYKEQLLPLPHYGIRFGEKRLRLEHMQTVNRTSRRIGFNSV